MDVSEKEVKRKMTFLKSQHFENKLIHLLRHYTENSHDLYGRAQTSVRPVVPFNSIRPNQISNWKMCISLCKIQTFIGSTWNCTHSSTVMVKSLHPLVNTMPVFSSSDVHSSHVSVMNEWNINDFVTKTFRKFGSVINLLLVLWKRDQICWIKHIHTVI